MDCRAHKHAAVRTGASVKPPPVPASAPPAGLAMCAPTDVHQANGVKIVRNPVSVLTEPRAIMSQENVSVNLDSLGTGASRVVRRVHGVSTVLNDVCVKMRECVRL